MKLTKIPKIFGVIGYPIGHTLSPYIHNSAFSRLGINAIYLPFEVRPEDLGNFLKDIQTLGVGGLNVTIPHKEAVLKFLDYLSEEARLIGAVNTIVVKKKGLVGYNTDAPGFIKAIKKDLKFKPQDKRVCVLGAGGAARAVCFALADAGAREILLTDIIPRRTKDIAESLERNFPDCNIRSFKLSKIEAAVVGVDLLINATPVGMRKKDPSIIESKFLNKSMTVYDLVYNTETKLVKSAKSKGLIAANGLNMLLYQGAMSFELWTGKQAPIGVMRKALLKALYK